MKKPDLSAIGGTASRAQNLCKTEDGTIMKILTWNINGIRASKVPLHKLFQSLDADIICLQETKVTSKYFSLLRPIRLYHRPLQYYYY